MEASREMERTRATDVISAVSFRRTLVESVKQALAIRRELQEAKSELAELLNIRPGTDFELAQPAMNVSLPRLPMSIENLEVFALENRPELRVEKYNERIGDWRARESLYNLLPGLQVSAGQNYNSDAANLSANWISTGVNMGMNLFSLFSGSSEVKIAENEAELARRKRLALSLAVLTQVHMSRIKFQSAAQQMRLAHEIAESDRKLTRLVRIDGQFLNNDYFEAVRLATQQIQSEMNEQRSYVDLVSAHADLMHSVGLDLFLDTVPFNDIPALADAIRAMMAQWTISDGEATEQDNSAQPANDLPPEIIKRLTEIAPSSRGSPSQTTPDVKARKIPIRPVNSGPPSKSDGRDETRGNSETATKNALTGGEMHNSVQWAKDINHAPIEPMIHAIDWAFFVRPVKSGSPSASGSPDETPATSQATVWNTRAGVEKHSSAQSERDLNRAAVERLTRSAPSSQGNPSETTPRKIDWEFSFRR